MIKIREQIDLDKISTDELMNVRICDLPIYIRGTWLEECVAQLYSELNSKGIIFQPQCYLADEWLTPEYETCIGIPFYLAHPKLIQIEKNIMTFAEGEGKEWCMKLLRHEAGHAICYAYRLYRRKRWQQLFGSPDAEYADTYKYRPYSKNFVQHLEGFYAQYHPEEDFVETFAVWLTPGCDWKVQYKNWGALDKLKYVDELMTEICGRRPLIESNQKYWNKNTLRIQLKSFYKRKRKELEEDHPDFHDSFLKKSFASSERLSSSAVKVENILRQYQKDIQCIISKSSGEKKFLIRDILKSLIRRSKLLNLVTFESDAKVILKISSYITALTKNYQYTGKYNGDQKKIRL